MKTFIISCFTVFLLVTVAQAQSYIPITNNMQITSYSNIKFIPNNYVFSDPDSNGVIQINGQHNIILDGDSCRVNGQIFKGYMIKINNSHYITIKNFDSVFNYKYAVYITNSDHITIDSNTFCHNRVDSAGWIDVWAEYTKALGGGVMMYQSRAAHIHHNLMNMQNDGVALYHCDSIKIHDNDFSWNTSYGIRMFWSDTCNIYQNNCSHVNRPKTDPSDCGALLMIISNNNSVTNNDLSWSGDGVFLGQYQHSATPNNNYFAYNECSYSPHNAIEATFAKGNVYKHNKCNYSDYGMWLGYSFQSVVDSNEINGNYEDGIAIDRGYGNQITNNHIGDNPTGIALWEGSPISGYTTQYSKDYDIHSNTFDGNSLAVSLSKTEHTHMTGNNFLFSQSASLYFDGQSSLDTITGNTFTEPTAYHFQNNSSYGIYAPDNMFLPSDSLMILDKVYDKHRSSSLGEVQWWPYSPGPQPAVQSNLPCDMAEPPSVWYAYPETGYPAVNRFGDSVYFDTVIKKVGIASVKMVTSRGYDLALNYRPSSDSVSRWTLSSSDTLFFWVRTIKNPHNFQYFSVRIGNSKGAYYKYTASPVLLNNANLNWKLLKCPVAGGNGFSRTVNGSMGTDSVSYVEIHADCWDYGYTLWVDGVQFAPCTPLTGISGNISSAEKTLYSYPNPFRDETTIAYELAQPGSVKLEIFSIEGKLLETIVNGNQLSGLHEVTLNRGTLPNAAGILIVRLTASDFTRTIRIIQAK
ncbi:MAG: right-handed parallel beta-helix repeat-containing protein [Bacteroidetes bacterium]|nr:right-handed parallel beta-helix repeat-containing protein [Bacteroidota bacterium]